jgi:hypothetical protein
MGKKRTVASSNAAMSATGSKAPTAAQRSTTVARDPQCDWSASSITKLMKIK